MLLCTHHNVSVWSLHILRPKQLYMIYNILLSHWETSCLVTYQDKVSISRTNVWITSCFLGVSLKGMVKQVYYLFLGHYCHLLICLLRFHSSTCFIKIVTKDESEEP